jgi:hypothetical protein
MADEPLAAGVGERVDGAFEPEPCECRRLAVARAEAGAPQQALCLRDTERPPVCGDPCQRLDSEIPRRGISFSPRT